MSEAGYREILEREGRLIFTPGGTSMRPMLRHHECPVLLVPRPKERLKKYDVPFYQRDNGQYVLHRIIKVKKDGYVCCGDGQVVPEDSVRDDMIFAVLKGYYKGGRYIDVEKNPANRIYARFWVAIRPIRRCWRKFKQIVKRILRRK